MPNAERRTSNVKIRIKANTGLSISLSADVSGEALAKTEA